ncbi:OB-fold domain-containing protein, partial [Thermoflexus hugenholtzii]
MRSGRPHRSEASCYLCHGLVKLEEGPLVSAMLTDVLPEEVYIGMPVEMVTRVLHRQGERGVIAYG